MLQAPGTASQDARSGPTIHNGHGARPPVTLPIAGALERLGLIGRRRATLALFGHRVTRQAIINWRKGRRQTPTWALVTAHNALRAEAESFLHHAALLAAEIEKRTKP